MQRRVTVVFFASLIFLIWNFSRPVLLTMAATFAASGVLTRIAGLFRRRPLDVESTAVVDGPQFPS